MPLLIGGAVVATAGLALAGGAGATMVGKGLFDAHKGKKEQRSALNQLNSTHYADYNQSYFEELQKRATMGMPEEQKRYAETNADRAAGYGTQVRDDRRAGLMGIGNATMSLADTYKQIANLDAQYKYQNQQQLLDEISKRGEMGYQETRGRFNTELALASQKRQQGNAMANSGLQTIANVGGGLISMGGGLMGGAQNKPQQDEEEGEEAPNNPDYIPPSQTNNPYGYDPNTYTV